MVSWESHYWEQHLFVQLHVTITLYSSNYSTPSNTNQGPINDVAKTNSWRIFSHIGKKESMHLEIMGTIYIMHERIIVNRFQILSTDSNMQADVIVSNSTPFMKIYTSNGWRNCLELTYDRIMVADQTLIERTDKKNDTDADKKDRHLYRNKCCALPLTQLTCKPTMSLRLVSCGHQPCLILACHTLVPCCTVAHPRSPCMFQARSAALQDFQTITLITRSGMLVLLCLQHCNQ